MHGLGLANWNAGESECLHHRLNASAEWNILLLSRVLDILTDNEDDSCEEFIINPASTAPVNIAQRYSKTLDEVSYLCCLNKRALDTIIAAASPRTPGD
ncbi:hypothetical protein C7212DRAFT_324195 [Tuber magnatum]|uniref:Uncharacterized protein n=1 Tax=Tuber magnatum TaxID=42249 RepID=A0A317SPS7_9PEZI|nr:hypothetical protein C7212DRAFT_324195 [Tuber magnatum]